MSEPRLWVSVALYLSPATSPAFHYVLTAERNGDTWDARLLERDSRNETRSYSRF